MSKQIRLYLPDEIATQAERLAKEEHMTIGTFCSTIVTDMVNQILEESDGGIQQDEVEMSPEDVNNEFFRVKLRGEDAYVLKRKASELGFTPTEWIRNTIHRKDLSIYQVQLGDLEEYLDVYGRHASAIEGVVDACRRNNNTVFKQDLELILERQEVIRNLMLIHLSALMRKREKAQLRLIKKNGE